MTTASSRAALRSASKELTLMSLQIQDSNRYTQDYWRGVAQGLTTAAQHLGGVSDSEEDDE